MILGIRGMFMDGPIGQSMRSGRRYRFLFLQCLLYLAILTFEPDVYAGSIAPDLLAKINSSAPQESIGIVIAVAGGISAAELNAYLDSTCTTLSDRRREGVLLLQKRANDTQTGIMAHLEKMKKAGLAKNVKSHWLTNTITVDLFNSCAAKVAGRSDVIEIFQYPEITPIEPNRPSEPALSMDMADGGVEENLKYIGADSVWKMGYTGEGRIVCHISDGVDGKHPALYNNWKGHDGNPDAAWIGEWTEDGYPAAHNINSAHGTHVVGIMVGHDDLTGDTTGVAPGAEWIGANGSAWEWAANPDGDPYTTDDVPDVINISFGANQPCSDRYWDLIDMTEALGIVNIMAAGNGGGVAFSIYNPASRADDSLTNFAVGSIDHRSGLVWWSSSRGPSSCDSVSIKPNVTAPGVAIRSSIPGELYENLGGTSMAAPHVSGAVAILRQYAPNASVREIKQALLAGCTPKGDPYPNNNYGWGIISIPASIEYLASTSEADLRILAFDYEQACVRDTIKGEIALKNRGFAADSVYIKFANDQKGVSVLSDSIHYGTMNLNQSSVGEIPFQVLFDDTMYAGALISLDYTIHGSNSYLKFGTVPVRAGIEGKCSFFTHKNNNLQFTVSNFGQYSNFRCGDTTRDCLYESALMIGTDHRHVSDDFRNMLLEDDNDFWNDASDSMEIIIPGKFGDQESSCVFDDGRAENRIGIQVRQNTYSWDTPPGNKYILIEYVIENVTHETIDGIAVGLALDWKYSRYNYDYMCEGNFSWSENLGFIFQNISETDSANFLGAAVLNVEGVMSYRVMIQPNDGYVHGPGLSDSMKFAALSEGLVDTNLTAGSHETILHVITSGPFILAPGESDTVYFAILGAESLDELKSIALQAHDKVLSLIDQYALPGRFSLLQNYPNPFNSATRIDFALPTPGDVELKIFNVLGQKVTTLVDYYMPKRRNTIFWDGTDDRGGRVATGIYLYRLTTSNYSETKKMILLK